MWGGVLVARPSSRWACPLLTFPPPSFFSSHPTGPNGNLTSRATPCRDACSHRGGEGDDRGLQARATRQIAKQTKRPGPQGAASSFRRHPFSGQICSDFSFFLEAPEARMAEVASRGSDSRCLRVSSSTVLPRAETSEAEILTASQQASKDTPIDARQLPDNS